MGYTLFQTVLPKSRGESGQGVNPHPLNHPLLEALTIQLHFTGRISFVHNWEKPVGYLSRMCIDAAIKLLSPIKLIYIYKLIKLTSKMCPRCGSKILPGVPPSPCAPKPPIIRIGLYPCVYIFPLDMGEDIGGFRRHFLLCDACDSLSELRGVPPFFLSPFFLHCPLPPI